MTLTTYARGFFLLFIWGSWKSPAKHNYTSLKVYLSIVNSSADYREISLPLSLSFYQLVFFSLSLRAHLPCMMRGRERTRGYKPSHTHIYRERLVRAQEMHCAGQSFHRSSLPFSIARTHLHARSPDISFFSAVALCSFRADNYCNPTLQCAHTLHLSFSFSPWFDSLPTTVGQRRG